ncbi:yae1 domain-containing protein 1-like [Mizuhopecten yessoensis]|uniref:Yae1 domain-containing protein 1 n=1 Tax=Mizuhopecten yessoensis TaxID=6573 RepID=A0A210PU80_MIZYE|nr:yae1 domain-containing protein 1-like [Mizuhopecten yessoensis]OWF40015.1 Yae1 domain-containing protein 1 [Mizuhopecten yessoensis]
MDEQEDDIFDENASEIMIGSRDWKKMDSSLIKLGYRDGISEGQEINVQEGFNQGYSIAVSLVFSIAVLRGEISAILSMKHIQQTAMDKSMEAELEQLLQEVRDLEQSCMKTSTSMENKVDQPKDSIQSGKEDNKVAEAGNDSNQESCVDCVCKERDSQGHGCGQRHDVQGQLVQAEERVDIAEHSSATSPDTKRMLEELQRRLKIIMESVNVK